jgi:hypothetical protein
MRPFRRPCPLPNSGRFFILDAERFRRAESGARGFKRGGEQSDRFWESESGKRLRAGQAVPLRAPTSVGPELAEPFDMALPSFIKHIGVLEKSRLIVSRKRRH